MNGGKRVESMRESRPKGNVQDSPKTSLHVNGGGDTSSLTGLSAPSLQIKRNQNVQAVSYSATARGGMALPSQWRTTN